MSPVYRTFLASKLVHLKLGITEPCVLQSFFGAAVAQISGRMSDQGAAQDVDPDFLKRVSQSLRKQLSKPVVKVQFNPTFNGVAVDGDDVSHVRGEGHVTSSRLVSTMMPPHPLTL